MTQPNTDPEIDPVEEYESGEFTDEWLERTFGPPVEPDFVIDGEEIGGGSEPADSIVSIHLTDHDDDEFEEMEYQEE